MPRLFTANEIINAARQKAMLPDTDALGTTDQDLLDWVNEYLFDELIGRVLEVKEEYFIRSQRTTLAANTSRYRINPRAMFQKLRDLRHLNSDDVYQNDLLHLVPGKIGQLADAATGTATRPEAFYLEGNEIVLWPSMGGSPDGKLEQVFPFRPGEIVLIANCRKVLTVDSTTMITLDESKPTAWTTANIFDIHSPSSGAEVKAWDKGASTVTGSSITFTSVIDGTLSGEQAVAAGDYVCLAGEAALPGLPVEMHPILGQAAACAIAEALGDQSMLKVYVARLEKKVKVALDAMQPRVEGRPRHVTGTPYIGLQGSGFYNRGV